VTAHDLRIGCSGWSYADWRGRLYPTDLPQRRWLERYAECFDTVEVNTTFYRLPKREMVAGWVTLTPPGFCFSVKVSRYVTHIKRLTTVRDGLARLRERIDPLVEADRLGPLLWQFPANFHRDEDRLAAALNELETGRHAFEFRHASWFCDSVYELLRHHGAALVVPDDARRPLPVVDPLAGWTFVRFHYGRRGRRGNYSATELDEWAQRLRTWNDRADIYAYFNNDWEGFAVDNALKLRELLAVRP
jgi:uncharacterized protein YecE (DUF72 family)